MALLSLLGLSADQALFERQPGCQGLYWVDGASFMSVCLFLQFIKHKCPSQVFLNEISSSSNRRILSRILAQAPTTSCQKVTTRLCSRNDCNPEMLSPSTVNSRNQPLTFQVDSFLAQAFIPTNRNRALLRSSLSQRMIQANITKFSMEVSCERSNHMLHRSVSQKYRML